MEENKNRDKFEILRKIKHEETKLKSEKCENADSAENYSEDIKETRNLDSHLYEDIRGCHEFVKDLNTNFNDKCEPKGRMNAWEYYSKKVINSFTFTVGRILIEEGLRKERKSHKR
jgi:hypothetical protein